MADIKALLADAKAPRATMQLCLRGDLQHEFKLAEEALAAELTKPNNGRPEDVRLNSGAAAIKLAKKIEAITAQMAAASVEFVMEAVPRTAWLELLDAHPQRKVNGDVHALDAIGVNSLTFFPALVKASVTEPALDDDDWARLLGDAEHAGVLSDAQFDEIAAVAWELNRSKVSIPFSQLASRTLHNSVTK